MAGGGATAKLWEARLTSRQKNKRVAPMPALMWENEIGDALTRTLAREFSRPLRFSHSVHRRNRYDPDVEVLAAAFELTRKVCHEPPGIVRGKTAGPSVSPDQHYGLKAGSAPSNAMRIPPPQISEHAAIIIIFLKSSYRPFQSQPAYHPTPSIHQHMGVSR